MNSSDAMPQAPEDRSFATTHWSLVAKAGDRRNSGSEAALAALCQRYWYPLYAFVRRRGYPAPEAQDLTQEFFAQLLEKNTLEAASTERGRFRSFLLTAMNNFLANTWDRDHAQKRGGHAHRLTLDFTASESQWTIEPADPETPERCFERQWALTLLATVIARLQEEFTAAGKTEQFETLKGALTGERAHGGYALIAAALGVSEEAARQAAHRLRKRYRELLREEVSQTVAEPAEVDEEIQRLFEALGN
jgi:RNA polymerase sigma-70 factor (ECF subfamily)